MNRRREKLVRWVGGYPSSRVHSLDFTRRINVDFFLKRDDELGWAGSKTRKYLSLIPFLSGFDAAVVVGSFYSNNVPALCARLLEVGVEPIAFLHGSGPWVGNAFLTKLFLPENRIVRVPKSENVYELALTYAEERRAKGERVFVVPEGAKTPVAVAGAASLALDLPECEFLFLDSGSGTTAASTILALKYLQSSVKTFVVLIAGDAHEFVQTIRTFYAHMIEKLEEVFTLPVAGEDYFLLPAPSAFGRVAHVDLNATIVHARSRGLLADPVYTTKFLSVVAQTVNVHRLYGRVVAVLSGGHGTIHGFSGRLLKMS